MSILSSVVDSWGKPESGILRHNFKWMGRYYECIAASSANINGKYCMAQFEEKAVQEKVNMFCFNHEVLGILT